MVAFLVKTSLTLRLIYAVCLYLFMGYSLYHIAIRQHVRHPWIAFVPFLQFYIMGSLCEDYRISFHRITHLQWVMAGFALLQTLLPFVGGLSFYLLRIAINLLMALFYHKFFYLFAPGKAVLFALLSFFNRLPLALILFWIKDKPMVMSAGAYPYPFSS